MSLGGWLPTLLLLHAHIRTGCTIRAATQRTRRGEDKVFPIKDRNPTHHVAFLTIALIVINIAVFAFVQDRGPSLAGVTTPDGTEVSIPQGDKFNLQHAAIPCEITQRRALDFSEVQELFRGSTDRCDSIDRDQLFPNKSVALSALASMFLHSDWFHLLFNMWFLWLFGNNIEDHLGPVRFVAFYLLAGAAATATHVVLQPDSAIPLIGASGAIAGVMGTYLIWFPQAPIRTYVFPFFVFSIRAIWLLLAWFILQFFTGADSQVAWGAHVGGFMFGVIVGALIRQIRALCRRAWREPWKSRAYYRWDLTGGAGDGVPAPATRTRPRFRRRRW